MRVISVICALLSAAGVAHAADLPVAPPPPPVLPPPALYNWTGFYIGLNGGATFANLAETATVVGGPLAGTATAPSSSGSAFLGGGQIGYNWQTGRAVVGIEGDFDGSGLSASNPPNTGVTSKTTWPWIATIRARLGAAFDRTLVYGTAGAAFTDMSTNITAPGFGTLFNASQVDTGWTVGGGLEQAFAPNWIARVEYLYVETHLSVSGPLTGSGGTLTFTGPLKQNIVRGGINYKFQ
jgi:outer membrane immunogenic protein